MLFFTTLRLVYLLSFSRITLACLFNCGNGKKNGLEGLLNSTSLGEAASVLETVLGDHGTVIFQNGLLKNRTSSCAAMSVIFARGTSEPGGFIFPNLSLDMLSFSSKS